MKNKLSKEYLEQLIESFNSIKPSNNQYDKIEKEIKKLNKQLKIKKKELTLIKILSKLDKDLANNIVAYCKQTNNNAIDWIASVLKKELHELDPVVKINDYGKYKKEEANKIIDNYIGKNKDLFKTDTYFATKDMEFVGHSIVDHKPIYDIKSQKQKGKITETFKSEPVSIHEVSKELPGDESKPIIIE